MSYFLAIFKNKVKGARSTGLSGIMTMLSVVYDSTYLHPLGSTYLLHFAMENKSYTRSLY